MNAELIKQYKPEFDHQLYGGNLQHRDEFGKWYSTRDIWNSKDGQITAVVVDDEYLPFRKALAEGKAVECSKNWDCHLPNWEEIEEKELTNWITSALRVKPDEPKFKVGQWVEYKGKPMLVTDGTSPYGLVALNNDGNAYKSSELKLWKPEPNDYCWDPYYGLVKIIEQNTMKDYKCIVIFGVIIHTTCDLSTLEPFIGTLPLNLQN